MTKRVSLDTNILVYAVDSIGDKSETAARLLRSAALAEALLTQQVIGEFLNVSRRMPHLDQPRLRRIAVGLCTTFAIVPTPRDLLFGAFDRAARFGLQYWDSVIVSVCIANAVGVLLSEDMQDGLSIDGIMIVNPFNPDNRERVRELLAPR